MIQAKFNTIGVCSISNGHENIFNTLRKIKGIMKLLAISDLHGDYSHVEAIRKKAKDFDALVISGDITNFGPDELAYELLGMFNEPIMTVPGNCDNISILKILEEKSISLHNSIHTIGELSFIGLGGSNPTPFNTPFELSEKKIGECIVTLLSKLNRNKKLILISHAPPRNTTARLPVGKVGSQALERFLGRFDLVVCGHIHEARGQVMVKGTCVVNSGQGSKGQAAMITIEDKITVEFIDA